MYLVSFVLYIFFIWGIIQKGTAQLAAAKIKMADFSSSSNLAVTNYRLSKK